MAVAAGPESPFVSGSLIPQTLKTQKNKYYYYLIFCVDSIQPTRTHAAEKRKSERTQSLSERDNPCMQAQVHLLQPMEQQTPEPGQSPEN